MIGWVLLLEKIINNSKKMNSKQVNEVKIIAIYLPQFHAIPENNKWWGDGFTEWTSTKKAQPLFKGHYQPKEPLNKNYYNLLELKTREWQAGLAEKYGVYGFCYYHYWFNGKKLLEKPAEEVLRIKKPDLPFCFSWANESWSRTWYSLKKETLLEQKYGGEKEWGDHFKYLLSFFKDERYIKVDNKPVFLIYKPSKIPEFDQMIIFWRKLAIKEGFEGIHITETLTKTQKKPISEFSEAVMYYEPGFTLQYSNYFTRLKTSLKIKLSKILEDKNYKIKFLSKKLLNKLNYNSFYRSIINRKLKKIRQNQYLGSFVNFDDTARRGSRAYIFNNVTPNKFEQNMVCMIKKAQNIGSEFLFVTAWNEWAEGAYLEPDNKTGYAFLEAIKKAKIKCGYKL